MNTTATQITSFGTAKAFTRDACSGTLLTVLNRAFGHPMKAEENASNCLAGGFMHGYQCGQLWGAALAAGAQAYCTFGPGARAEAAAMNTSRRLVMAFNEMNGEINCLELTDSDMQKTSGILKYVVKGGPFSCGRMAMRFAPIAFRVINESLAEEPSLTNRRCASCAATLARKMGASDLHATMAAGLAAGIGFSGGGCGSLAAAMWITAMNNPEEKFGLSFGGTKIGETLERFMTVTDHEFECSEIAGRTFDNIDDHAQYLRDGGCSRIIEALVQSRIETPVFAEPALAPSLDLDHRTTTSLVHDNEDFQPSAF